MRPSRQSGDADVCLLLEGTYPYVLGGVSSWVHDLIKAHSDLRFALVSIVADDAPRKPVFEVPGNVVAWSKISLSSLRPGNSSFSGARELPTQLAPALNAVMQNGGLKEFIALMNILGPVRDKVGSAVLLNAPTAWDTLLAMYEGAFKHSSFIDYFWTWRALLTGFYAVVLADIPKARAYHAISTGYAGILAARAALETGRPALITEHGIYTNERRIEITLADWLHDPGALSLGAEVNLKGLKALWISAFSAYSRICYEAAERITTLYRGNQDMQRRDGADAAKMTVIPNGVDIARYGSLERKTSPEHPTVALIGRVVPIKDIKTYIRAVGILKEWIPDVTALVLGPTDEDASYSAECRELVEHLGLQSTLQFTGRVKLDEYFPLIDVNVLTSVSEAQPLVILEAGAAGIPSVATDVGCCRELVLGVPGEMPAWGPGGAITPLASPMAVASALKELLSDRETLARAGEAMKARVRASYEKSDIDRRYRALYQTALDSPTRAKLLEAA
jgi:glycosyltransferase involved in cell wall biosynthesis